MYENHREQYPDFDNELRVNCMNTSERKMIYMKNNLVDRKKRTSIIESEDIENLIEFIVNNPFIGGRETFVAFA